jgi:hypothetical protein
LSKQAQRPLHLSSALHWKDGWILQANDQWESSV